MFWRFKYIWLCSLDGQRYEADSIWPGIMGKLLGDRFEVIADGKNGRTIAFDDPYMEGCNGMLDIEASLEAKLHWILLY